MTPPTTMTIEAVRKIIEGKRKRNTGMDIAAEIDECLTRNACNTDEAAQLRREYGIPEPNPVFPAMPEPQQVPAFAGIQSGNQPGPFLLVNWGIDLAPGIPLEPEFTIIGLAAQSTPLVYFLLKIPDPVSNPTQNAVLNRTQFALSTPELTHIPDNSWQFHQSLEFNRSGQYLFRIRFIDSAPGQTEPGYYCCQFRVPVSNPSADQGGSLTINADDSVANLGDLLSSRRNVVLNLKDTVLHAPGQSPLLQQLTQTLQSAKAATPNNEMQVFNLLPSPKDAAKIPYVSVRSPISRITLHTPNKSIRLVCGSITRGVNGTIVKRAFTFGRDYRNSDTPQENSSNDVPLEIFPGPQEDESVKSMFGTINRLFPRLNAKLEVTEDGVQITRQGGRIVIDGQWPLGGNDPFTLFPPTDQPRKILFAKMLALNVTPYHETVDGIASQELPGVNLLQLYHEDLLQQWPVSAIKVTRNDHLVQENDYHYLQFVMQNDKDLQDRLSQRNLTQWFEETFLQWLKNWLNTKDYRDPQSSKEESLLIVTSATLGDGQLLPLSGHVWHNVRLRVLNLGGHLYLENMNNNVQPVAQLDNVGTVLRPLRPIPIRSGLVVSHGGGSISFE